MVYPKVNLRIVRIAKKCKICKSIIDRSESTLYIITKKIVSENYFVWRDNVKILNLGSLNIDITYQVDHVVIPGETIKASRREQFCGGKGLNQSIALAKAGASVYHAGCIGADGEMLTAALRSADVDIRFLEQVGEPSGHAIIQVDGNGQNSIIIYSGANACVSKEYIDQVTANFGAEDVLLLQNEISNIAYAIQAAKKQGMRVAINPSPYDEKLLRCELEKVDYFILNEVEGQQMTGCPSAEPLGILEKIRQRYPQAACVLTLGTTGAYYSSPEVTVFQPSFRVKSVDSTGAGDTFTGFFLAGITQGLEPISAMRRAAAAAAISVGRRGASASIPTNQEVQQFLDLQHT